MGMYKKLSNIDFKYFIGQKVTEVTTEKDAPLGMTFDTAGLIIECPWRLLVSKEIVIGYRTVSNHPIDSRIKMLKTISRKRK